MEIAIFLALLTIVFWGAYLNEQSPRSDNDFWDC
jgi:hypothetical protein